MSIHMAALSQGIATTAPATQPTASGWVSAAIFAWLVVALIVGKLLGAYRRRSIVGPPRLPEAESTWLLVFLFFGSVCLAQFIAIYIYRLLSPAARANIILEGAIVEGLAVVFIITFTILFRSQGIERLGLFPVQVPRGIALGATTLFILLPIVIIVEDFTVLLLNWAHRPTPTHEVLQALQESHAGPAFYFTIAFAVVGAPLAEELAFRGFLQTAISNGLHRLMRSEDSDSPANSPEIGARWIGVAITSLLFAAVHGEWAFFLPLFVLSLGLGYLYERTGNLWASISTHALFNGIQITLFLSISSQ